MNLTVRINGKEYRNECVQGVTFSEEYNETLDSGSIRLTHILKLKNLRPYDDVYIYDSKFDEYSFKNHLVENQDPSVVSFNDQVLKWKKGGNLHNGIIYDENGEYVSGQPFYRHLLIDQFAENVIKLGDGKDDSNPSIYSYFIELFSETKRLETIQLPNVKVTQPLVFSQKKTIAEYLQKYINQYSPKVYVANSNGRYEEGKKYILDPNITAVGSKHKLANTICPDFAKQNANLRDVLSTLMITCDMIPYVKDDVVYAKDISSTTGSFDIAKMQEDGKINFINGSMQSTDYYNTLRREYGNAISEEGTTNFIEQLGFRSPDKAIMALSDIELTLSHPIYKMKKIYMCYYKRADIAIGNIINKKVALFIKQDITPLIKLDSEWQVLNQDWRNLNNVTNIEELSKYKLATIPYSIGSKKIGGWGFSYTEYDDSHITIFKNERTYLQNILIALDNFTPYGINDEKYYIEEYLKKYHDTYRNYTVDDCNIAISTISDNNLNLNEIITPVGISVEGPVKLKGLTFEIEYTGFYSGAIKQNKLVFDKELCQNDNVGTSLTILEKDGEHQKSKIDRIGNKQFSFKGRYSDVKEVLDLGNTTSIDDDENIIIYRRQYNIFNNMVEANYAAIQNYVLKNYFTSVYAKYRTYQLMPPAESLKRADNIQDYFIFSTKEKYYSKNTIGVESIKKLFSAWVNNDGNLKKEDINVCIFNNRGQSVFLPIMSFVSGGSFCLNFLMPDNISGGDYVTQWVSDYKPLVLSPSNEEDYVKGMQQQWISLVDSNETGKIEQATIQLENRHKLGDNAVKLTPENSNEDTVNAIDTDFLVLAGDLPKRNHQREERSGFENNFNITQTIKFEKENSEVLDVTYQITPISIDEDFKFSDWMLKLSDMLGQYPKYKEEYEEKQYNLTILISGYDMFIPLELKENQEFISKFSGKTITPNIGYTYVFDTGLIGESGSDNIGLRAKKIQIDSYNNKIILLEAEDSTLNGGAYFKSGVSNKFELSYVSSYPRTGGDSLTYMGKAYREGYYLKLDTNIARESYSLAYYMQDLHRNSYFGNTGGDHLHNAYSTYRLLGDSQPTLKTKQNLFVRLLDEEMPKDIATQTYDFGDEDFEKTLFPVAPSNVIDIYAYYPDSQSTIITISLNMHNYSNVRQGSVDYVYDKYERVSQPNNKYYISKINNNKIRNLGETPNSDFYWKEYTVIPDAAIGQRYNNFDIVQYNGINYISKKDNNVFNESNLENWFELKDNYVRDCKSYQLWYFDNNTQKYNFVFGANNKESLDSIEIAVSNLVFLDKQVYDPNGLKMYRIKSWDISTTPMNIYEQFPIKEQYDVLLTVPEHVTQVHYYNSDIEGTITQETTIQVNRGSGINVEYTCEEGYEADDIWRGNIYYDITITPEVRETPVYVYHKVTIRKFSHITRFEYKRTSDADWVESTENAVVDVIEGNNILIRAYCEEGYGIGSRALDSGTLITQEDIRNDVTIQLIPSVKPYSADDEYPVKIYKAERINKIRYKFNIISPWNEATDDVDLSVTRGTYLYIEYECEDGYFAESESLTVYADLEFTPNVVENNA